MKHKIKINLLLCLLSLATLMTKLAAQEAELESSRGTPEHQTLSLFTKTATHSSGFIAGLSLLWLTNQAQVLKENNKIAPLLIIYALVTIITSALFSAIWDTLEGSELSMKQHLFLGLALTALIYPPFMRLLFTKKPDDQSDTTTPGDDAETASVISDSLFSQGGVDTPQYPKDEDQAP